MCVCVCVCVCVCKLISDGKTFVKEKESCNPDCILSVDELSKYLELKVSLPNSQ